MVWIITYSISLIIILVQILIIKNTIGKKDKHSETWEPIYVSRWVLVVYLIVFLIPIGNLVILFIGLPWISWYCKDKYYATKWQASNNAARFVEKVWKCINEPLSKPL